MVHHSQKPKVGNVAYHLALVDNANRQRIFYGITVKLQYELSEQQRI
jgi:hypothetical protein